MFRGFLLFAMVYLGPCGADSMQYMGENKTYSYTPRQEIIDSYIEGVATGATHMLVVWDTWNFEDSYTFIVYSYPYQDVSSLINYYNAPGFYKVSAVFAMHLDIKQQLSEKPCWHSEYPVQWYSEYP